MKKLLSIIFVILLAASLIGASLVGCSGKTASTTSSTSTTTALEEKTVLIGVTSPLTGGAAAWGIAMKDGTEMAFDDLNNAGGLTIGNTHYTFKVTAMDDQYNPTTSTNDINTLVADGAQFLFVFESTSLMALAPTLAQDKVLQFTVAYDDTIIDPPNAYTFRTVIPPSMKAESYYKWILSQYPNVKTMAHISEDNVTGQNMTQVEDTVAKADGLTVTDEIYYEGGTTDFTSFVTKGSK